MASMNRIQPSLFIKLELLVIHAMAIIAVDAIALMVLTQINVQLFVRNFKANHVWV